MQALRLSLIPLLFLILPFSPCIGAEVFLKESSQVKGERVLLKDIATVKGSPLEVEILSRVPVSRSPQPCRSLTLSKREVARKLISYLRENKVNFREIELKGASTVKVKRLCTVIDGDRIKGLIEAYLKENYPDLILLSVPSVSLKLPVESFEDEVSLSSLGRGYGRFVYKVYSDGKLMKKLFIPVKVDRKVKVLVARLPIPKGAKLREGMVELKELPSRRARGALTDLKGAIGKVSRRDILPGEVIKERDLQPNFIVKKGKPVKVIYEKGGIHIELLGVPLENGSEGNIIRVKNLSTGKILRCRVEKDGSVTFLSD